MLAIEYSKGTSALIQDSNNNGVYGDAGDKHTFYVDNAFKTDLEYHGDGNGNYEVGNGPLRQRWLETYEQQKSGTISYEAAMRNFEDIGTRKEALSQDPDSDVEKLKKKLKMGISEGG